MKTLLQIFVLHSVLFVLDSFAQHPSWETISSDVTNHLNSVFFYDHEVGYAVGDSGIVIKSIDSGKTWQSLQTPTSFDLNDLYVFSESSLSVVGDQGTLLYSGNGGNAWSVYPTSTQDDLYSVSFAGNIGICGGSSQTILWGTYTGTGIFWVVIRTGFLGGGFLGAHMINQQIGFVAGDNSIFQPLLGMTSDGGTNWNFTAFYLNNNEGKATGVNFTDLNLGYISASVWNGTGAIAKTTDGGTNWNTSFFDYPLQSIHFPISSAGQIGYAVGDSGTVLKTYDAGAIWETQISGTNLRLNKVFFMDSNFGFAIGENGIILRTTNGGEPVTNIDGNDNEPDSYQLFQNYPNPFNPSTKIKFTLPNVFASGAKQSQSVTLKIYDILGNEITTLVNEELPLGEYEAELNTSTISHQLSSGIYFYQLQAGEFIQTKKMILMK